MSEGQDDFDIILVATPLMSTLRPAPAPAFLKAVVEKEGFRAQAVDLNMQLKRDLQNNIKAYKELCRYFRLDLKYVETRQEIVDKSKPTEPWLGLEQETKELYKNLIDKYARDILKCSPKSVGVSVFSSDSILFSTALITRLKNINPQIKVIIGGAGIKEYNFSDFIKLMGVVDHIIYGEGEIPLVQLLRDNLDCPGIDDKNPHQIDHLDELPFGDYSDYLLGDDLYCPPTFTVVGSRGCVRACQFCDVGMLWPKYRYRSGASLAEELVLYWQKYGQRRIVFSDSLVNGSKKNLMDLCNQIIDKKEQGLLPGDLNLSGQFICPRTALYSESDYDKLAQAGFRHVSIGVESGSNQVLRDMRKQFAIEDLDYMLAQLSRTGIMADLMFIVGFPTETEKDFQGTLNLLKRYKMYSDGGTILALTLGKTMGVLSGSPIGRDREKWGIMYDKFGNWYPLKNPELTLRERIKRRVRLQILADELGYRTRGPLEGLMLFDEVLSVLPPEANTGKL